MIEELVEQFQSRFGRAPVAGARAPGRVNVIGEHTDYNEGLVLPCAIDRSTVVLVSPRADDRVRVFSRERAQERGFDARAPARRGDWVDYLQGAFAALQGEGVATGGFDIAVASSVPLEAGLSSSAALALATVTAIDAGLALGLAAPHRCRLAQRAETEFVGVPCGSMDFLASGLAQPDSLLRIDCRSLEVDPVPWPVARARLLVADSGTRRALAAGDFAARRAECARALEAARGAGVVPPEARALRDVTPAMLGRLERALPRRLFRRLRHVVSENERVTASCAALRAGDVAGLGELLREGMRSLREDFEVSTPALDELCRLADGAPGVYGSRLTGAGFGGCAIVVVEPAAVDEVSAYLAAEYARRTGRRGRIFAVSPAGGAAVLDGISV
jgi:galactokinase